MALNTSLWWDSVCCQFLIDSWDAELSVITKMVKVGRWSSLDLSDSLELLPCLAGWCKQIHFNLVRNKRNWCVWGSAGRIWNPRFMSNVFWRLFLEGKLVFWSCWFWQHNKWSRVVVQKCILSERSLLLYSVARLGSASGATTEPTAGWVWQSCQIQQEGNLVDIVKEVK